MCIRHKRKLSLVIFVSLGLMISFAALAQRGAPSFVPVRNLQADKVVFSSMGNYTPFPDLSTQAPETQLQTLAERYAHVSQAQQSQLIRAAVRQHAFVHQIPTTVALGISGHESGGWKMWKDQQPPHPLSNINYRKDGHIASTDWGVMQINDLAHPEAFPRARQDVAYNIAFGMELLARTHQVYRGSLNLGFGQWDTTIAAYHLGHAPSPSEMPLVRRYVQQMKTVLLTENLLPEVLYTVQRGDTLDRIASRHYGAAQHWERIWHENRAHIPHPAQLRAGMEIRIPLSRT